MILAAGLIMAGIPSAEIRAGVVSRKQEKEERSVDTAWERALDEALDGKPEGKTDGMTEDDGAAADASTGTTPSDYSYLTQAFRARNPFAVSRTDDRGRSLTECLDRGDTYELTNVSFFVYKKYDAAEVRAAGIGDTLRVDGKAFQVAEIGPEDAQGYSEYILERTDGYGEVTRAYLVPVHPGKNKKGYYIAEKRSSADGSFDSAELYATGSMFLRKDAVVVSANAGSDGLKKVVNGAQYVSLDRRSLPDVASGGVIATFVLTPSESRSGEIFTGGFNAAEGTLFINGSFAMDEAGNVISFAEKP